MSEASAPAPTTFHDAGALAHSPPPSTGTSLLDFPPDATFRIWRKPNGKNKVSPIDCGSLHVSKLIPDDGVFLLVCFATLEPHAWTALKHELGTSAYLNLKSLLVASVDKANIGSGLWGTGSLAGQHGLTTEPSHATVFVPSSTLMRLLKIERGTRTRNALVLIRNGHIVAEWVSDGEGNQYHDWTKILTMID